MEGTFNVQSVDENDYVTIMCSRTRNTAWFDIPGIPQKIWVIRVSQIVHVKGDVYALLGWFNWNQDRNLLHELHERYVVETVKFREQDLVGVFEYEDNFAFTRENIKDITDCIMTVCLQHNDQWHEHT